MQGRKRPPPEDGFIRIQLTHVEPVATADCAADQFQLHTKIGSFSYESTFIDSTDKASASGQALAPPSAADVTRRAKRRVRLKSIRVD